MCLYKGYRKEALFGKLENRKKLKNNANEA